ncbi:DUF5916 domain-containing protein [Flagellimonas pacifica]|uniref:Carbohydrate family 9 binding domain-like n=1 Tax=Flagellimonas pacifica TaxID=1247520 RepID=A0A285ME64_9FLAO|nr:DUF5916 domain-containing protein [Allomuricauda parva]SNY95429.1 Carbohydrate family 9 binding domain-like [Allomuricauda parva]
MKTKNNCLIIGIFSFLICIPYVKGQESDNFPPPENPQEIQATKAIGTITIDGKLSETDWKNAPILSSFFRIEPKQGGKYRYQTEVRLLYDNKNLYVGAFCKDSLGAKGVRVQDLRRDFSYGENDIFAIQIDAQNTKQYAVSFQTTPYGNQRDLQNFNDDYTDNDWNALWKVRTQRTPEGYYAEFAIPFKSLRYDKPKDGLPVNWGITFFRLARRDYEQTVFPEIPQAFSPYRMTYAAKLIGLEVPPPSANIRIEPYTLYQFDETKNGNSLESTKNDIKVGGDVKWVVSPNSVVDLTVNTDFAQADVDRAVNNLERFNIFFPERRQFFLENSGIWAGASNRDIIPFFSRQIGLQGGFNAAPAPIDVGARFTNRDEKKTLAGLYVHQGNTNTSTAAHFGVFRYLQNYGKENNLGIMVTHRLDKKNNALSLNENNNTTLSIDGLVRPKDEWTISYLASASKDEAQNKWGYAGKLFAGYTTNKMYWGWSSNFVSKDYDPAMGFVYQKDVIQHNPGGYFILRPKKMPWIRRWDPGLFINYYHDFSQPGNFQQASLYLFPIYTFFKDNSFLEYAITPTWQNINFDFAPLGLAIANDRYYYTRQYIRYRSDQSKKFSLKGKFDWGKFYKGHRETITAGARYAPIPHFSLSFDYEFNHLKNIGIEEKKLETNLYTGGVRLALNPRVQLSNFYQYNSFTDQVRWNARFSWEYSPNSFLYLVYNNTQNNSLDPLQTNQQFIGKLTLLKQF